MSIPQLTPDGAQARSDASATVREVNFGPRVSKGGIRISVTSAATHRSELAGFVPDAVGLLIVCNSR